jgi:hypothetical protein
MNGKLHSLATRLLDAVDPLLGKPRWYRRELARAVAERDRLADARLQLIEQIHKLAASHRQLADNHQRLADNHQSLADNHQELANRLQALAKDRYRLIDRYLVLLQDCLTGSIYEDPPLNTLGQESFDPVLRQYGWDWPSRAHTMIGRARLANIRTLAERVLREEIPGDFIETGVWRGGACILMRGVLNAFGIHDRRVWLADSFEGLPPPDAGRFPADANDTFHTFVELAVGLEEVKRNFEKYGLLDDQVRFLKGWFRDTLPGAPVERLALLRLDGDMYESTIIALESLYGKLSPGGFVIIDDYHVVEGCRQAVHDFMTAGAIVADLHEIDGVGVYWRKPDGTDSPA